MRWLGDQVALQSEGGDRSGGLQQEWTDINQLSNKTLLKNAEGRERINIAAKTVEASPQAGGFGPNVARPNGAKAAGAAVWQAIVAGACWVRYKTTLVLLTRSPTQRHVLHDKAR